MRRALVVLALVATACAAVPDVTYAPDDASLDQSGDVDNTCPTVVPAYATMCCGPIACFGPQCVAACNDCVSHCTLADLCCPNAQARAVCKPNLQCP